MKITHEEFLLESANKAFAQVSENPTLGIPLDPDVADYVGAFEENAISLADVLTDALTNAETGGM